MKILVAYESMRGHTRRAADTVGKALRTAGHEADIQAMDSVSPSDVADYDALALGTWTKGLLVIGVGPAGKAKAFLEALPRLDGKPVGIFCTYLLNPRGTLDKMAAILERKGANVTARLALKEKALDAGVDDFASSVAPE